MIQSGKGIADGMIRTALILAALVAAAPALAGDDPPAKPADFKAETRDCLQTRSILQTQAGADHNWYARLRDGRWWRNNMNCPTLQPRRALVHSSPIGSQCRGDIVQVIDFNLGGINFGGCGLGSWERVAGPPGKAAKPKG
jgi:hypothetical protein